MEDDRKLADLEAELAAARVGLVDPEGVSVARFLHGRLPESERPPFGEWLGAVVKDPSAAPRTLVGYLPPAGATAAEGPRVLAAARGTAPSSPGMASLGRERTIARIGALAAEAQRTGDWSAYDRERAGLLALLTAASGR